MTFISDAAGPQKTNRSVVKTGQSTAAPFSYLLRLAAAIALVLTLGAAEALDAKSALGIVAATYLAANILYMAHVVLSPRRGGLGLMLAFFFLLFVALPAYVQVQSRQFPFF